MNAAEKVRQRLLRVTAVLDKEQIPYAVVGGNAVAAWVGSIDPAAIRNTADVDILMPRSALPAARVALEAAGFIYNETLDVHMFLDGPQSRPRDAVHLLFAGEKVKPDDLLPTPEMTESERGELFQVVNLEALVRMKLTSFRRKDQVHIQDMISVGLINASWVTRFPPGLASRLQELLDDPNG